MLRSTVQISFGVTGVGWAAFNHMWAHNPVSRISGLDVEFLVVAAPAASAICNADVGGFNMLNRDVGFLSAAPPFLSVPAQTCDIRNRCRAIWMIVWCDFKSGFTTEVMARRIPTVVPPRLPQFACGCCTRAWASTLWPYTCWAWFSVLRGPWLLVPVNGTKFALNAPKPRRQISRSVLGNF